MLRFGKSNYSVYATFNVIILISTNIVLIGVCCVILPVNSLLSIGNFMVYQYKTLLVVYDLFFVKTDCAWGNLYYYTGSE